MPNLPLWLQYACLAFTIGTILTALIQIIR